LTGKRIVSGLPPLRGLPKATGYAGGLLLYHVFEGNTKKFSNRPKFEFSP
jgi:hypothetical protein